MVHDLLEKIKTLKELKKKFRTNLRQHNKDMGYYSQESIDYVKGLILSEIKYSSDAIQLCTTSMLKSLVKMQVSQYTHNRAWVATHKALKQLLKEDKIIRGDRVMARQLGKSSYTWILK